MINQDDLLFFARPSLRRAYFYSLLFAGVVVYGRYLTELDPLYNPIWLKALGLLLLGFAFACVSRWCTCYEITENEVRVRSGILARRFVVVPKTRITNAFANQSFLERLLGLVNFQIDCAGGDTKEVTFARITKTDAKAAGQIIREFQRKAAPPSA